MDDKVLLNATIAMYLNYVDDANALGKIELVNRANESIKRSMFNSDVEYYNELSSFILSEL